jgi:hypothetical protein
MGAGWITAYLVIVSENRFHARQAALALLKMAKTTSDPKVAAGLIEIAADLKDQAGELPPPAPEAKSAIDAPREGN